VRRVRALCVLLTFIAVAVGASPASAISPARVNGTGSSWVDLAMQQWVAVAQTRGLPVNYQASSSPEGLTKYADGLIDFSATEAEYSALIGRTGGAPAGPRGFQYVPDVGGATAVMYHVQDLAGRNVNYLHLSMRTIARIFMGDISNWDDPAISADNKGLKLPDEPITVLYRGGQSGTTATFYDFVAHAAPDLFASWAARFHLPTAVRIIQLDGTPNFAPHTVAFGSSDQIAQQLASSNGLWSIGYDEFGYASLYGVPAAWVQNASGHWVLPYKQNISAALESARLRPDLSQELSGVYQSQNPLAYPISEYSYLVVQCARTADRPTCTGSYPNPGTTETLARWMSYIECEGQANLGDGYSPLPPNLSQEISNAIGRMQGTAPQQLTAANCSNPRFHGSLGQNAASPPDPLRSVPSAGGTTPGSIPSAESQPVGGEAAGTNARSNSRASGSRNGTAAPPTTASASGNVAAGRLGAPAQSAGGGTSDTRTAAPVAYDRPAIPNPTRWLAWIFVAIIVIPPFVATVVVPRARRYARRRRLARTPPTSP